MMYQINPLTDCRNYSLGFKHPVDHILLSPDYGRIAVFYGRLEVGIIVHGSSTTNFSVDIYRKEDETCAPSQK